MTLTPLDVAHIPITVAQCNTPHKVGRGWPEDPQRTSLVIDVMSEFGADVVVLNELYTAAQHVWQERVRWDLLLGDPNYVRHGEERGNGIAYRTRCRLIDSTNMRVKTGARTLNFPVGLFEKAGAEFAVLGFHFPAGRGVLARSGRARCRAEVIKAAKQTRDELGIPVIIAGDSNDGTTFAAELKRAGFRIVARDGIDLIAVLGEEPSTPVVALPPNTTLHGRATDHRSAVAGTVEVRSVWRSKLPDLGA